MRKLGKWLGVGLAMVVLLAIGAALGDGGTDDDDSGASVERDRARPGPVRGVATIAAELAPHCVDRLGTAEQGDPATPEIERLVDDLIAAYEDGPKNAQATQRVEVSLENMRDGCGPDQAPKLAAVLERSSPPAEPTPEPEPDGSYELNCDYVLGDFGESGNPERGFRFVGGGEVENTGNVGIRTRVRIRWQLLGGEPVVEDRTVKVPVGGRRDVQVSVAATQDQIDLHQSADGDCSARASIVGTYGDAE